MPHRAFTDSRLIRWEVWEVVPAAIERRVRDDRRADARPLPERRGELSIRYRIGARAVSAWLCFESRSEKRRLTPVPERWEHLAPDELEALLLQALPAPRTTERPGSSALS